jgi:hypothetical protein
MSEIPPARLAEPDVDWANAWVGHLRRRGQESGVWLALSNAKRSIAPVHWQTLLQRLAALDLPPGKPSFFQAVFMFVHGGKVRWLRKAGLAAQQCGEIERVHAFMVFVWGVATGSAANRELFRELFEQAGFPGSSSRPAASLAGTLTTSANAPVTPADEIALGNARPVRRVAIISQQLSIFAHAGTRLALEHAALLKGAGAEVCVFSAQEMQGVDMPCWLGCPGGIKLAPATPASWKTVAGPGTFQVVMANAIGPLEGRWQSIAAKIANFAPDVVLFVGFFSPLLTWAWKHYPVVGLSVHTLPPLGPVDVWLQQFEAGEPLPEPWAGLPPPVPFPYAFRLALPPANTVSLAPLNLPPGALIMVTVGYRLRKEIRQEWATQVLARLEAHPRWVWLLVGDSKAPPCLPSGHPQIRVLDHQDNMDALLQHCSLYLNPSRMGGGFSIMNAIARGVPVVSLGGSDGGDKLGSWRAASQEDYWRRVDELMADEAARIRYGQELSRRFDRLYNLRSATPSLLAALDEGRRHFRQRTEANE